LWTIDNQSVIYRLSKPDGTAAIMRVNASGTGEPELLLAIDKSAASNGCPESISHDGKALLFRRSAPQNVDVMMLPLDGADRTPRPLLAGPSSESNPRLSLDGRWVAYMFSEVGSAQQLFVRPYPGVDANRWPVSSTAGGDPVWARSSREVFFVSMTNKVMGVTVQPGPVFGQTIELFDNGPYLPVIDQGTDYDVSSDGRQFLMIKRSSVTGEAGDRPSIVVVTHWVDELKSRVK
jgi:Tol biopolymer transport system component